MQICVKYNNNESVEYIGYIVNIFGEILILTDDVQVLQRGSSFLKLYIPLCLELIEKQ